MIPLGFRELSEDRCGLLFVDLLRDNRLNKGVGSAVFLEGIL